MGFISIIIVTCNSAARIQKCLDSVMGQRNKKWELIVVDNASTDKTKEILKCRPEQINLIENSVNFGYAKALNQGIAASAGEFILCLNDDVVLQGEDFLTSVSEGLNKDGHCGAVQPKMLKPDGAIDTTGIKLSFLRRYYDLNHGQADAPEFNREKYIFGACDAAVLYRRKALKEICRAGEYFDEDFFGLVEDVDLSWRLQKRGWSTIYSPQAVGIHYRGLSRRRDHFSRYLNLRNRYFMLIKNESLWGFLRLPLVFLIYDLWRNLFMLLINPGYVLKTYVEVAAKLPEMLNKRKD